MTHWAPDAARDPGGRVDNVPGHRWHSTAPRALSR